MESKPSFFENIWRTKPLKVIHAEENSADLPRSLSLFDLICIGIGGTVGSGVFATTGDIISGTAGPAAVLSWTIAGVVCCMNALAYMELSTRVPSSGSTYAYSYHAIGELPAVVAAWLLTLEYGVSGAGVARSWAGKVQEWLQYEHPGHEYNWLNTDHTNFLGALIMALSVIVLLCGVRFGKFFVNTITTLKVVVVLFIIVAGFAVMDSSNLSPFIPDRISTDDGKKYGFQGVITGASQAFFGYIGFDEVCCLAAEAKNPKTTMPRAVIGVVTGTMFLSVFASLVLSGMQPFEDVVSFPVGFEFQGKHWAAEIVRAGETVTMPVVVLISFLAQPRLNYALACDGLMPQIFAKVDDKGNLFVNTLMTGIFFTVIAFLVPFDTLWDIVSFGILLSFVMSNVALMMVRTRKESPNTCRKYIGAIVVFSLMSTFFYQQGYVNDSRDWCLVLAIIFLVLTLVTSVVFYIKCPQEPNDPVNFSAPLVPFIPTISILADFYLAAQISHKGMALSCAWIGAAIVSYFVYGYGNSAGRTGWSALLNFIPRDSNMRSPILSVNEIGPSMTTMVKEKKAIE
ncbi:Amino acid-polyamine-organocation, partial [Globisporangium splendens]